MKLKPIITSLLDIDAYKPNMGAVIARHYGTYTARWALRIRNKGVYFTPEMVQEIRDQIDYFCALSFTKQEIEYLKSNFKWLPPAYILTNLKNWRPNREDIQVNEFIPGIYNTCGLSIEAEGTWIDTSLYEIAILAIVSEVWFAMKYADKKDKLDCEFQRRTIEKFRKIKDGTFDIGTFSEFGTRRRYSKDMHDWLVKYILNENIPGFVGTSNIGLAAKYNTKAIGSQAHEMFMAVQAKPGLEKSYINAEILRAWNDVYKTKLGIALTDTIGTEVFLKDFDENYATLFSGVRHDSGDPYWWGELMLDHYNKLGIDPKTKTLLFSDSLNFEKATAIRKHFKDRTNVAFGIGTFLTADTGVEPLNVVFKMIECNGKPVCKLSNNPMKIMCCDNEYVSHLERTIAWRLRYE